MSAPHGSIEPTKRAQRPIDEHVRIGHVHRRTAGVDRVRAFYVGILGFDVVFEARDVPAWGTTGDILFVSAGGHHHHLGFSTWLSRDGGPQEHGRTGLHHVALNFSSHAKLAEVVQRLVDADVPLRRLSDHGTHLAVFLWDPDGNDLEPAWDRPVEQWPRYGAEGVEFLDAPFELDERVTAARWGAPAKPPTAHARQPAFKEDSSWRSPSSGPATWAAASPRARSPADTP